MTPLQGKIAVVTGGNSGIGYATAERFRRDGATVVITGRSAERVAEAARALSVEGVVADVRDLASVAAAAERIGAQHGRVDVLFVNAGVGFFEPVGGITEESFDAIMDVNFKGAVFTLERFLPYLQPGSSVINLSSINAHTGMSSTAIYAASKAAMNSYTRTASTELAARGIRVNAINPGPVETPFFGKTGLNEEQIQGFATQIQNAIPLGRFGKPEDVANVAAFLASDQTAWVTGSEYTVDGGSIVNRFAG